MVWLALWLFSAEAAEIQVAMSYPGVIAVVDGVRQVNPNVVMFTNLTEGMHKVEIRNLIGQPLAEMEVQIDAQQRVRLQYANRALIEQGRGLLPSAPRALPKVEDGVLPEDLDPPAKDTQVEEHAPAPSGQDAD